MFFLLHSEVETKMKVRLAFISKICHEDQNASMCSDSEVCFLAIRNSLLLDARRGDEIVLFRPSSPPLGRMHAISCASYV